ncbi:hypothetical protein B0H13DRAFT_2394629 [Mycena leptocephala]|nr:hypothetical protein B0H13DRAFT_2394629 [Mycena leptocephala]
MYPARTCPATTVLAPGFLPRPRRRCVPAIHFRLSSVIECRAPIVALADWPFHVLICAFHPISLPVQISPTLIADVLIPGKPMRARPGYVSAAFCGSSLHAAFLCTRSLARSRTCLPPVPCAPLALVVLLPLLHVRAHDGDSDQCQLKHKPVFCCHASSRMQGYAGLIRVLLAISRTPLVCMHGHAAFKLTIPRSSAASCHILQDHMRSSRHRHVIRRVVPLRRPDASRNCAVWSRSVVVVGTRDTHASERAAIVISSVRSLAGTGIEKRMYWFGDPCHRAFGMQEMPTASPLSSARIFRHA